jgi:predicted house-cleaning NTP pyrophosphatase (Maf/HAM1 superfamily)
MDNKLNILVALCAQLGIATTGIANETTVQALLAMHFDALADRHFEKMIQQLYMLDVSEQKLSLALKTNSDQTIGAIAAQLAMQRAIEKAKQRAQSNQQWNAASGEEAW